MDYVLDIGGEGRHAGAWNLNPSPVKTIGVDRGQPIPNHIAGRAEEIPLPDGSVDWIIMERCPLRKASVHEMARVIARKGTITLVHARQPSFDPHLLPRQILPGRVAQRQIRIGRQMFQETTFVLVGNSSTGDPLC